MSEFRFCPWCGTELTPGAGFCHACGRPLHGGPPETGSGAGREPGILVSGTVTDTQGEPLAGAEIDIRGTSLAGQNVMFKTESGPDGTYALRIANGVYKIVATVELRFRGESWTLQLAPGDGSMAMVSAGGSHIEKDFRGQISGQRPDADGSSWRDYYGGAIWIRPDSRLDEWESVIEATGAQNYTCEFVLTPISPLIDGTTAGKQLVFTRTMADLLAGDGRTVEHSDHLHDIPIGNYNLTGRLTAPLGLVFPLGFSPPKVSGFYTTAEITFTPAVSWETDGPVIVLVTI